MYSSEKFKKYCSIEDQNLYFGFIKHLEDSGKKRDSVSQFTSAVHLLYKHNNYKNISELIFKDVESYLLDIDKLSTRSSKANYLKTFFGYALEQKIELNFPISEIDSLIPSKADIELQEDRLIPDPLKIHEIINLRKILDDSQNYRSWMIFELIYQYGFNFNKIKKINESSYDEINGLLRLDNNESYEITEIIRYLIENKGLPQKSVKTDDAVRHHLNKIKELIGRRITPTDIEETRKINFMKCPKCGNLTENKPNNWIIWEYEYDGSQWLVCKINCYREVLKNVGEN